PMNFVRTLSSILLVAAGLGMAGCATIPGENAEEQATHIDSLVIKSLADVVVQAPQSKDEIAASAGYVIMSNKLTKIPLVGVGWGYGVGVDNRSGERTYLKMSRFDLGLGVGARAVRPVVIFQDAEKFREYID